MLNEFYNEYQAIIFDCDGTLVDTMPAHYRAWIEVLTIHGIAFPEERFYQMGGMATAKIVEVLAREAGKTVDPVQVALAKDRFFSTQMAQIQPIAEVVAIARANKDHIPLAVATGATRAMAQAELAAVGIYDWFKALACAEDVERHKPHPDVYLEAARRLGVAPARCLAFDDTDIGLAAARSAGMTVRDVREMLVK